MSSSFIPVLFCKVNIDIIIEVESILHIIELATTANLQIENLPSVHDTMTLLDQKITDLDDYFLTSLRSLRSSSNSSVIRNSNNNSIIPAFVDL